MPANSRLSTCLVFSDIVPPKIFSLTTPINWSASPAETMESSTTVTPGSFPDASATAAFIRSSNAPLFTHADQLVGVPSRNDGIEHDGHARQLPRRQRH